MQILVMDSSMQKMAAALIVLLLLGAPVSSARLNFLESTRGLLEAKREAKSDTSSLAVELMHIDHINSPYVKPNLTSSDRAKNAMRSSIERFKYFTSRIHGTVGSEKVTVGKKLDVYESPERSNQGSYVMQIQLGTPPSTFHAIADTGSDLCWLQCDPCTQCLSQPDPLFNPAASSSYSDTISCTSNECNYLPENVDPCSQSDTCLFDYVYGDESQTKGNLVYETITLTDIAGNQVPAEYFVFGCGTDNVGSFANVDGLVGLGGGPLSLVSQLGSNIGYVFSYCLVDFYAATSQTSNLLLGSVGWVTLQYTPLVYNPVNPTFYYVTMNGITVDGTSVSFPSDTFILDFSGQGGFILDSGTTVTLLYDVAYTPFLRAIQSACTYPNASGSSIGGYELCYDTSSDNSPSFPTVVFQLQNLDITLPSANTFLQMDNYGTYCLAFANGGDKATGISIFGNVQQQNFQIGYDLANSQVGFAETWC